MSKPIYNYYKFRLKDVGEALEANNFEVHVAQSVEKVKELVFDTIIPERKPATVSFGGATSLAETGIHQALLDADGLEVWDTWDKSLSLEDKIALRRKALHADMFFMSTNALTEDGMLVNLDMIGNRVGALAFGPKTVVVVAGRNKIVPDLQTGFDRIKNFVAPTNAIRLKMKTPCVKTGRCMDCKSPERICNVWTITEKSFPDKRIIVILVNEDLGF